MRINKIISCTALLLASLSATCPAEETIYFNIHDKGETKAMTTWGAATIGGSGIVNSTLKNMGADQIDLTLMIFPLTEPLTSDGKLSPKTKSFIDRELQVAKMTGDKPLVLSPHTEAGIDPSYLEGPNKVDAQRWADLLIALGEYIDRPIAWVQPFNEPDYPGWGQGTTEDLSDIMGILKKSPVFESTKMAGPATLNADGAIPWFKEIKRRVDIGTIHTLAGSFDSYVDFIKYVKSRGKVPFNPEFHNLAEAIVGAEYGLDGGIWWLSVSPTRGAFVKACQGKRLAYAEVPERWSAAAVYRAPDGSVLAFLGSNERTGQDTTYKFVCRDKAVYFDGQGPYEEYTVTINKDSEKMIRITWD